MQAGPFFECNCIGQERTAEMGVGLLADHQEAHDIPLSIQMVSFWETIKLVSFENPLNWSLFQSPCKLVPSLSAIVRAGRGGGGMGVSGPPRRVGYSSPRADTFPIKVDKWPRRRNISFHCKHTRPQWGAHCPAVEGERASWPYATA